MTDMLLEIAQSPIGRALASNIKLPIPLPEQLMRPKGASVERFLEGKRACVGGDGELGGVIAELLCRAGAESTVTEVSLKERFIGPAQAYGRPTQVASGDPASAGPYAVLAFDATGLSSPQDLRALYAFFHPRMRRMEKSAHVVIIGRPPEDADSPDAAAACQALDGFVRSLAKETGGRGSVCNLLYVQKGAESRLASPMRFFLSGASAFVTAQPLRVTSAVKWDDADPWVKPLAGKTALVTGAARGIGAATVEVLAAEGAHVVCLDRPAEDEALSKTARQHGGSTLLADVSEPDTPTRIADALLEQHGGVDIVIHNAGVTRDRTLANMDQGRWDMTIGINLQAVLAITDKLAEKALHDGGRVVSLASIAGIAGNMGQTNYAASKAGLIGFTRHMAGRVAKRGVTFNAVAPGFIETQMTAAIPAVVRQAGRRLSALGQGGLPEDVARTVTFLSMPGSAGVTGNVLRICGGALLGA